jgi:hypothetical protein
VKKAVVATAAVIAVAGLAVAAVPLAEEYSARQIKVGIELDGAATVETVEVGLFTRSVTMHNLHVRRVGDVNIGRWQASGLAWPLGELLQGRTPLSGLRLGDPLRAGHLELADVRIIDSDAIWNIGSLTIDGLDLGRYDIAGIGPMQFSTLSARMAAVLSVQKLEQKHTVYTAPGSGDRTAIGAFTVEQFDRGRIGAIVIADVEGTPKAASEPAFKMAELKVTGLDLTRPFAALSSPAWRPSMPIGRISVQSGSASGFSGEGLARYGVSLGSITTETTHEGRDISHSRTRIDGFVLAPPISSLEALQAHLVLQTMGLKEVRLAFECAGTEDRGKGEIAIERCAFGGPDLGEVNLTGKLVEADEAFWKAIDEGDTWAFMRTKAALGGARLVIADKGLLERALRAMATTTGRTPPEMRAFAAREVRQFQPTGVLITEDLTKLLDTVARFIETGGTLTLDAAPDPPLGLDKVSYLRTPGPDWASVLGLSATLSR